VSPEPFARVDNAELIDVVKIASLKIVSYPDPVLRAKCKTVETYGEPMQRLTERMWELMREHKGVGLAGPQVGLPIRIFVFNATGEPEGNQVCINPRLEHLEGQEQGDEGCLSIEGVTVNVRRAKKAQIVAHRPDGSTFRFAGEDLVARIWQHEADHLNGRLIIDYQSASEELANRRALRQLEDKYKTLKAAAKKKRRRR
jgi:peptide deformylase